ncbi:hypothetical protein WJX79_009695 [Trebouxia sp. C0005]
MDEEFSEGLRRQDLDADCRHFLETSPEDVKAQALAHFVDRLRDGVVKKPSAFLTTALLNASKNFSPTKTANGAVTYSETKSLCPSAIHLLDVLAKEGFSSSEWDSDCQAYLSRSQPAVQTQGLQGFLVQWRTGRIKNPSAYLTDLLGRAYQDNLLADHDPLPFIDLPASRFTTPRKVAVPILAPLPFVSATAADISVLATHMKIDALANRPHVDAPKPKPVQENKVHDTIMRHFAKQFIPMDRDELMALKLEDLEIIMKLQGEAGVVAAIDQADETAKMMPLYDISDEAGQTELLLKELEYAAQVIVDKLEQDGQLSA